MNWKKNERAMNLKSYIEYKESRDKKNQKKKQKKKLLMKMMNQ